AERTLLTVEQVSANVESIRHQLSRFLDFERAPNPARLVNNADWLTRMSAMEFLRDDGNSYTEFSYSLLQAYDFLMLHDRYGCTLQVGGSDQWGNIVAGIDLIRRVRAAKAHGLVMPLLTTSSGAKFGKTEGGAVWLDAELTSPYEFYQFWFNADDRDAARYLKFFTFLDEAAITALEAASAKEPEKRHAQRELAREVTRLVHGDTAVQDAEAAAEKLFRGDLSAMSVAELLQIF